MIIYRNTKGGFVKDVRTNRIASIIETEFEKHNIFHNNSAEFRSWANSLQFMRNAVDVPEISDECKIAIEYQIPLTAKRVDFLIAGADEGNHNNVVVIELKQWETSETTSRPDIVSTFTGGATRNVVHPSYQAYSYAKTIESFNENVEKYNISLYPCAYLHNYKEVNRNKIDCEQYSEAISLAPVFLQDDTEKLTSFIKRYVIKKGDEDILFKIEEGRLRPAKALQDALGSMIKGNKEFYLIDEQKVAYEQILDAVVKSLQESGKPDGNNGKYTIIVEGGPGTGKSVIAIQLLCELLKYKYKGYSALYVTKNAAPRNVYFEKLRGLNYKANYIHSLFTSSGSFWQSNLNDFDCLIVDEAHRLQMKSGMFQNAGACQIKEIIHASKVSVFFIDEDQVVTTSDAGRIDLIKKSAEEEGSKLYCGNSIKLVSQFRCNGSDGYLAFLDNLLGRKETANKVLDMDYDFRVFDSPSEMREVLRIKNEGANKSRMLAGYCYNWVSKTAGESGEDDICLSDGFRAKWNFSNTGTWAIDKESFDQVGCIHTSQGLEFEYVGVIIGKDLVFKDGKVQTDYTKRAKTDQSLKGIRQSKDYDLADRIIRNTYKTLMSRGQKGCYVYCEDEALSDYIKQSLSQTEK